MRGLLGWTAVLAVVVAAAVGCGSKSATCTTGAEGCACFANDTCLSGLTCASHLCVNLGGSGGGGRGGGGGQSGASGGSGQAGAGGTAGAAGSIATAGTSGNAGTSGASGATAGAGGAAGAAGSAGSGAAAGAGGSGGAAGAGGSVAGAGGSVAGAGGGVAGVGGRGGAAGTGGSGGASAMPGCQVSDVPPSMVIADFEATDGGVPVIPIGGPFVYPSIGGPMAAVVNGGWRITAITTGMTTAQYLGVGIYFNGNAAGTDCIDATQYTGIQFDIAGTITGTGCAAQLSINDSQHTDAVTVHNDPKASGPAGAYSPQVSLTITSTVQRIMIPFVGTGSPAAGNPATGIDKTKLTGMQWQFTTAAGTTSSCLVDVTIDNVKFY